MVPIDGALKELSALTSKLKSATEELNGVIEDLNARLAKIGPGVSAWTGKILNRKDSVRDVTDARVEVKIASGYELGYARVDGEWMLAVRKTRCDDIDNDSDWIDDEPLSLLKAPRNVRVEAAGHFEKLINAISRKAEGFIANVEDAKKLVGK
jgi:hypothetical protein